MNELPEGYVKGVARVSNIVSFVFPFEGNGKERYLSWLADDVKPEHKRGYAICPKMYMKEAQDVGTFIHLQMENKIKGKPINKRNPFYKAHKEEIVAWIAHIDALNDKYGDSGWQTEVVMREENNLFQGTIDLVRVDEKTKTVFLYDWKTYWIAKKRWNLPNKYKKQTDKYKKLALQLSLYAYTWKQKGYKIGWIYWLYLHETGCYETELKLYTNSEIEEILGSFIIAEDEKNNSNNKNSMEEQEIVASFDLPMVVEILEPTKQYGNVKVSLDLSKIDNGKTDKENVDELIKKAKYIAGNLKG